MSLSCPVFRDFSVTAAVKFGPSQPVCSSSVAGGEMCRHVYSRAHRAAGKAFLW